jgi:hypothetical protein
MQLEQLFVFPIASPLTSRKRLAIEAQIQENAQLFEKDVQYHWLQRGEEKFLRLVVDPATIEIVFHDDRVELFGAVPTWARLFLLAVSNSLRAPLPKCPVTDRRHQSQGRQLNSADLERRG